MNMRQQNGQNGHQGGGHRRNNNNNRGGRHGGGNGGGHRGSGGNGSSSRSSAVPLRNQVFDSHGPDGVRVRGNAFQVYEKYMSMAREAGEREEAESLHQHAEHYFRIVQAIQEHENEQRARFTPSEQPVIGTPVTGDDQPQPVDPFSMTRTATPDDTDSGLTDLRAPLAVQ